MFDPYRTSEQFHDYDTSPDIWPSSGDMNTSWTHSSVMNRTSSDGICAENLSFASSRMKYHEPFHPSWDDRSMDTASFTYSPYPRDSGHPSWNGSSVSGYRGSSGGSSIGGAHIDVSRSWGGDGMGGMTASMLDSLPVGVIDGYMTDSKRMLVSEEDVLKELMEPLNQSSVAMEVVNESYHNDESKVMESSSQQCFAEPTVKEEVISEPFSNKSFILKEGLSLRSYQIPAPLTNTPPIIRGTSQFRKFKRQLDNLMANRTSFSSDGFLLQLQNLTEIYPTCGIPWLELSSAQHMEGDLEGALGTLTKGLAYLPTNETLLEKRIKLAERVRNPMIVIESTLQLLSLNTSRGTRSGIEGIMTLAKMNQVCYALSLFTEVIDSDILIEPSSLLDYVRFVGKIRGWKESEYEFWRLKTVQPEYSSIWFYELQMKEQKLTHFWNGKRLKDRCLGLIILKFLKEAENYITGELLWKVFCNAAQAEIRSYTHVRTLGRQCGV